jgi:phage tail sheath protein FI
MANLIAVMQAALTTAVGAANFALANAPTANQFTITSAAPAGPASSVEILPGLTNDVTARLKLGVVAGGTETDGSAQLRPSEAPAHASLLGGATVAADIAAVGSATSHQFRISIDGSIPLLVDISPFALVGPFATDMTNIGQKIKAVVSAIKPNVPAFRDFQVDVVVAGAKRQLRLSSGSRGSDSSVLVSQEGADTLAQNLHLLIDGSATTAALTLAPDATLTGGSEAPVTTANQYAVYTGNQASRTGLYALEDVDIFNLLCLPGIGDSGILMECDAYVKTRRAFLLIDSPVNSVSPSEMTISISGTALPKSDHAAVFYPWIGIANPLNSGAIRYSAPVGTIAGLMARTDASRGVWKAPAGTEAQLTGVQKLKYNLTDAENGILNPQAINCHRIFPDSGAVAWGSRTLAGSDANASEWKYIPIRRTALFIEESLFRGLKWVVFEPNDEPLWAQIRLNVGAFMNNLFREGAFQGTKKDDAYFVKCDSETTTQNDRDLGRVNILVGFAPLKPAEFVILYLQQMAGQIQV